MERKVITQLKGGLGNQLFQFSCAYALAKDIDYSLYLDTWTGFYRDKIYRRRFALDIFKKIGYEDPSFFECTPFITANNPLSNTLRTLFNRIKVYQENDDLTLSDFGRTNVDKNIYMKGYWQSERYFSKYRDELRQILNTDDLKNDNYAKIGERMRSGKSLAISMRLYEESPNPTSHSRNGKFKTAEDINSALRRIRSHYSDLEIYIFCTHTPSILGELDLENAATLVTHDEGYDNQYGRLWLLSQCRHHILTNSTFYWWGAWLSETVYEGAEQYIQAADNFLSQDTVPERWQLF